MASSQKCIGVPNYAPDICVTTASTPTSTTAATNYGAPIWRWNNWGNDGWCVLELEHDLSLYLENLLRHERSWQPPRPCGHLLLSFLLFFP